MALIHYFVVIPLHMFKIGYLLKARSRSLFVRFYFELTMNRSEAIIQIYLVEPLT
jgi:hypothetical protein